jgi:hypothetical protein
MIFTGQEFNPSTIVPTYGAGGASSVKDKEDNEISSRQAAEYHVLGFNSFLSEQAAGNLTQERLKNRNPH